MNIIVQLINQSLYSTEALQMMKDLAMPDQPYKSSVALPFALSTDGSGDDELQNAADYWNSDPYRSAELYFLPLYGSSVRSVAAVLHYFFEYYSSAHKSVAVLNRSPPNDERSGNARSTVQKNTASGRSLIAKLMADTVHSIYDLT